MKEHRLANSEKRFADLIWDREPVGSTELVKICEQEFDWKKSTTYTMLKKLCDRGLFKTENSTVTALISKDEFYAIQSERFVSDAFDGSLPAFIAAFTSRKQPSDEELEEIRRMIDAFGKE